MNKLTKLVMLATLGVGMVLSSGVSMAAGTASAMSGTFTIDTGAEITAVISGGAVTCPVGTCADLPGSGAGILMRTVDDGTNTFIQTIIAEGSVAGDHFANEQVVQQGVNGTENDTNIAQKQIIVQDTQGFNATSEFVGTAYLSSPSTVLSDPYFTLNQNVDLGTTTAPGAFQKVRIRGAIDSAGGNTCDSSNGGAPTDPNCTQAGGNDSRSVYIDQGSLTPGDNPEFGEFAYRWGNTGVGNTLAQFGTTGVYTGANANDNVGVVFMHQKVPGVDPADQNFGLIKYYGYDSLGTTPLVGAESPAALSAFATLGTGDVGTLFELDVPALGQVAAASADGYGTWGTASTAESVFGVFGDTTDFVGPKVIP